jgi:hypothetical protein
LCLIAATENFGIVVGHSEPVLIGDWTSRCSRALVFARVAADKLQRHPPIDTGPPVFRSWEAALMRSPTGDLIYDDQDEANRNNRASRTRRQTSTQIFGRSQAAHSRQGRNPRRDHRTDRLAAA